MRVNLLVFQIKLQIIIITALNYVGQALQILHRFIVESKNLDTYREQNLMDTSVIQKVNIYIIFSYLSVNYLLISNIDVRHKNLTIQQILSMSTSYSGDKMVIDKLKNLGGNQCRNLRNNNKLLINRLCPRMQMFVQKLN